MDYNRPTVFIVNCDHSLHQSLAAMIKSMGLNLQFHDDLQGFIDLYNSDLHGCIIIDIDMRKNESLKMQERLKESCIDIPVIIVTNSGHLSVAVQAIKNGAINVIEKPFSENTLEHSLREALEMDAQNHRDLAKKLEIQSRFSKFTKDDHTQENELLFLKGKKLEEAINSQ